MPTIFRIVLSLFLLAGILPASGQVGIGTTTPDAHSVLDLSSTTKGVLFPRLTTAQQTTLTGILGPSEMGMIVIDATTGTQRAWSGSAWTTVAASNPLTAAAPLSVTSNNVKLNAGTNAGDLLTWDGANWVNTQPAVQHFSISVENRQPYLVINYVIGLQGIYPSQNDATEPYLGEIYALACNFAPIGFAMCNGQLLSISQNTALFSLIGTIYGGDGVSTFQLPNLQGRTPVHMGNNGSSNYIEGQLGGTETKTFTH